MPASPRSPDPQPLPLRRALFRALRAAGRLILKNFEKPRRVMFKDSPINLVTEVDQAADRLIQRILGDAFPAHDRLTEESVPGRLDARFRWIVDPLDGTTNFAHGFPQCAVSIALEERLGADRGRVLVGGVYDPFRDELFWAARGRGAWLERGGRRRRLRVSATPVLQRSLLLTGFPYDRRERVDLYLSYVREFMQRIQGIRRAGAAALDLCWVAAGRVDGYWEWRLKPWDSAAGALIVEEAGGRMSDFSGRAFSPYGEQTLATNGRIHAEMLRVMRRLDRGSRSSG